MDEELRQNNAKNIAADRLATAAFVMGLISMFSTLCCCPFIFSAIGIILALLSKGTEQVLRQKAKTGLIMSIAGLVVSFVLTIFTIAFPIFLIKTNPEYKNKFIEMYEETLEENENQFRQMYGDDVYEDMLKRIDDLSNL